MLSAVVVASIGLLASPATAAAPVPGATYVGTHGQNSPIWEGTVQFTVSADGNSVTSVLLRNVKNYKPDGSYAGYWPQVPGGSAPIVNGAFQVPVAGSGGDFTGSYFKGSFTGPESAAGTLYVTETVDQWTPFPPYTIHTEANSRGLPWTASVVHTGGARPPLAPQLSGVSQSTRRWRLGNALPHYTRATPPVGTIFRFTLDMRAPVKFAFTQAVGGRRVGEKCVAVTKNNSGKPHCLRTAIVATLRHQGNIGKNGLHFEGRINPRKWLEPGSYTLKITATANSKQSKPAFLRFTILR